MRQRLKRLNPRVKYHESSDTYTISGIPSEYARSIFTKASLQMYDVEEEWAERRKEELAKADPDEFAREYVAREDKWHRMIRNVIDLVDLAFAPPYVPMNFQGKSLRECEPWEIWIRKRDIKARRKGRLRMKRINDRADAGEDFLTVLREEWKNDHID